MSKPRHRFVSQHLRWLRCEVYVYDTGDDSRPRAVRGQQCMGCGATWPDGAELPRPGCIKRKPRKSA